MYYFTFLAKPKRSSPKRFDYGGAFVHCWVNVHNQLEAEQSARTNIDGYGWQVESLETSGNVSRDHYGHDDEALRHFTQAEHDGHCVVFETWSPEAEEGVDQAEMI